MLQKPQWNAPASVRRIWSFLSWTCEFAASSFPLSYSALWGRTPHDKLDSRLTGATVISKQIKAVKGRKHETLQRNLCGTPLFRCAQQVCNLICSFNPVLTPVRVLNKIVSHVFFSFCFSACAFLVLLLLHKVLLRYHSSVMISDGNTTLFEKYYLIFCKYLSFFICFFVYILRCCFLFPFSMPFSFSFQTHISIFPWGWTHTSCKKHLFLIRCWERFIKCVVYGYMFSTCVFWLAKPMVEPQAKLLSAPVRWLSMTDSSSPSSLIGSQTLLSFLPFPLHSCELNRLC